MGHNMNGWRRKEKAAVSEETAAFSTHIRKDGEIDGLADEVIFRTRQ